MVECEPGILRLLPNHRESPNTMSAELVQELYPCPPAYEIGRLAGRNIRTLLVGVPASITAVRPKGASTVGLGWGSPRERPGRRTGSAIGIHSSWWRRAEVPPASHASGRKGGRIPSTEAESCSGKGCSCCPDNRLADRPGQRRGQESRRQTLAPRTNMRTSRS
jgi:hypothetical protein